MNKIYAFLILVAFGSTITKAQPFNPQFVPGPISVQPISSGSSGGNTVSAGTNIFLTTNGSNVKIDGPSLDAGSGVNVTSGKGIFSSTNGGGTLVTINSAVTNQNILWIDATNGSDITAIKGLETFPWRTMYAASTNSIKNDIFIVKPGVYVESNVFYMKPGQELIGSGWDQTFVRQYCYLTASNSAVFGNDWTWLAITTNNHISDLNITNAMSGLSIFSASIGRSTNVAGATNVLIERVKMWGDTDNFYIDNTGAFLDVRLKDCYFNGTWDVFAVISTKTGITSDFSIINCTFNLLGPTTEQAGAQPTTPIRMSGAGNMVVNVIGGRIISSDIVGNISTGNLFMHGTTLSYGGTNFIVSAGNIRTYGMPGLTYDKTITANGADNITASVIYYDSEPQSGSELGHVNGTKFQTYWNTNTEGVRVFNGVNWDVLGLQYYTNKLLVTGASDSSYNGIFTWKTNSVDGYLGGWVYTNLSGRFLMYTTNETTVDTGIGLSPNQTLSDGLEFATCGAFLNRSWDAPESAIRVVRVDIPISNGLNFTRSNYVTAATSREMNTYAGKVKVTSGQQTYVITNNKVENGSYAYATVNTTNATSTACQAFPGSGVLTLKLNAAATADCDVSWWIMNPTP